MDTGAALSLIFAPSFQTLRSGACRRASDHASVARERFLRLAEALNVPEPERLADSLLLLLEGAYGISQTLGGGPDGVGHSVVWASEMLVEAQLAGGKSNQASKRNRRGSRLR